MKVHGSRAVTHQGNRTSVVYTRCGKVRFRWLSDTTCQRKHAGKWGLQFREPGATLFACLTRRRDRHTMIKVGYADTSKMDPRILDL